MTPDDLALVMRHRAFLDRRDTRGRLDRIRRYSHLPDAMAARQRHWDTVGRWGPTNYSNPILDVVGIDEFTASRAGALPLDERPKPSVEALRARQLAAWERARLEEGR